MTLLTVDTLTELKALDPTVPANQRVEVIQSNNPGNENRNIFIWDSNIAFPVDTTNDVIGIDPKAGIFVHKPGKTTTDTHGTIIADGAWRRVLEDNFLTPYMFGGTYDVDIEATDSVQAMINFAKSKIVINPNSGAEKFAFYNNGDFDYACSLAGRMWKIDTSLDATDITAPGFWFGNGGLNADFKNDVHRLDNRDIVLDLAGTNTPTLENLHIFSSDDETKAPSVGVYYGRQADGKPAANAKFVNLSIQGSFSKAAIINFASETSSETNCRYFNNHSSKKAFAAVYTDNMQTLADQFHTDTTDGNGNTVNGVVSKYVGLPTGSTNYSNILHHTAQLHVQRPSKTEFDIVTITSNMENTQTFVEVSATTGMSTMTPVFLNKVTAHYDFDGDPLKFEKTRIITELNNKSLVPSDIDGNVLTFDIEVDWNDYREPIDPDADPIVFVDPIKFTGKARNQTGPAMLIAGAKSFHGRAGYILTYANSSIVFDCRNGSGIRQFDLNFQPENNPNIPLKFIIRDGRTLVQGFNVEMLSNNQTFASSVIETSGGTGWIEFENFHLRIAHMTEAPVDGIFMTPDNVELKNALIEVPLESALNDASDFRSFSGSVVAQDTLLRKINFTSNELDESPLQVITVNDSHLTGPFIDTIRYSGDPANQDRIGGYRYLANDDNQDEQIYAMTRGRILRPTPGDFSGALDIVVAQGQTPTQAAQFAAIDSMPAIGNDNTALFLRYNTDDKEQHYERVTVGAPDSGGTDSLGNKYRVLRVPNNLPSV